MLWPVLAVALAAIAGCGGCDRDATTPGVTAQRRRPWRRRPSPRRPRPPAARRPTRCALIRRWGDLLRHGRVTAGLATVVPAGRRREPRGRASSSARAPRSSSSTARCRAAGGLVDTELRGRYVVATFVLTERPDGLGCGSGVGHKAQTAFLIKGNRIAEWLRVLSEEESGGTARTS